MSELITTTQTISTTNRSGKIILSIQFWEIEYHIPASWTTEQAIEQCFMFASALLAGYESPKANYEQQRRAEILAAFIVAIPSHLPQTMQQASFLNSKQS